MKATWKLWPVWFTVIITLAGCRSSENAVSGLIAPSPTSAVAATAAVPPPVSSAETQTAAPTVTSTASAVPASPTAVPTATITPTPHPLAPYTIEGMRERPYAGGEIEVLMLQEENESFRRYFISYPSDELTISGTMNIPRGQGPYPVVILLHGYYKREQYYSGADTWQAAELLASNGYLTIAPDYRSWGSSDSGQSFFHTGLVADVINLINALPSLPQADTERIGLLGHSMGGGIATKVLVIDDRVSAAVLHAPNSADDADLIGRWGPGCLPDQSFEEGDACNPGEIVPADLPQELVDIYLEATGDELFLQRVAPINYLEAIKAPVQIHIGEEDGETLQQTPPQWSRKLYEAMKAAGVEVTFFSYPGEGHYFKPAAWGELMGRALAFFDEEMGG
ncbi:MAG: alpha/beta hydrolase family protein [Candidatus Promineifilaceae bacterium]|jgi:dienelactone hydrolase